MVGDLKLEEVAHHVFYLLYPGVAKLNDFATVAADDVIVLFETIGLFILSEVLAKLVLGHQVASDQQVQSIIDGSPAHPVILGLHVNI